MEPKLVRTTDYTEPITDLGSPFSGSEKTRAYIFLEASRQPQALEFKFLCGFLKIYTLRNIRVWVERNF